jgi:hypothetical protein
MALINCPECGKAVSETAVACPHCGFGVANYTEELQRKRDALEKEQEKKRLLEMKQIEKNGKKEKKAVIKQMKSNYLKQYHKKSLWVFAALLPYSVIGVLLPYVQEYIVRKQMGLLYVEGDTMFSWLIRNCGPLLPMPTCGFFVLFMVPAILYIIANNIKNIKVGKTLLVLGLLYTAVLAAFAIIGCIIARNLNIAGVIRFLIPLCCYIALYRNATHIKESPL